MSCVSDESLSSIVSNSLNHESYLDTSIQSPTAPSPTTSVPNSVPSSPKHTSPINSQPSSPPSGSPSQNTYKQLQKSRTSIRETLWQCYAGIYGLEYQTEEEAGEEASNYSNFYWPIFLYIYEQFQEHKCNNGNSNSIPPLVVGISAPQGCGKTTLTNLMKDFFQCLNMSCLALSLDDFYLTYDEQIRLASEYSENPLLAYRGNPGTHDLPLLVSTLYSLINMHSDPNNSTVYIPQFDKSLHNGRGDRVPINEWLAIDSPPQVLLFEGWMLGFTPKSPSFFASDAEDLNYCLNNTLSILPPTIENLLSINHFLEQYEELNKIFDCWCVFSISKPCLMGDNCLYSTSACHQISESKNPDEEHVEGEGQSEHSDFSVICPCVVFKWRLEAEHKMIEKTGSGLTDDEILDFSERFFPAYRLYLSSLYADGPQRRTDKEISMLKVSMTAERHPISFEVIEY